MMEFPSPGRCVVVSPHLDDAILSCYPLIRSYQDQGYVVELWTVMAGTPNENTNYSDLATQISGGDPIDYVRKRQKEDLIVTDWIRARAVHFPFVDALYRCDKEGQPVYPHLHSLFEQIDLRELCLVNQIHLALLQDLNPSDLLLVPSATGKHIDHMATRLACEMLPNHKLFYVDFPYAIQPGQPVPQEIQRQWRDAILSYNSQVGLTFPGNSLSCLLATHHPRLMALPQANTRIPRTVHFIWVGDDPLPSPARKNLENWTAVLGPGWQVRLWTNEDLTETEFDLDVLKKINEAPHGVQKADILRYHIMRRGGWYFDLDFEPLQSIEPIALLLHQEEIVLCHEEDTILDKISNGFFACASSHPAIEQMAEAVLNQPLNTNGFSMADIVMHTGPVFFKRMLENVKAIILPRQLFYPVAFSEIPSGLSIDLDVSFARHIWNSRYQRNKDLYFPKMEIEKSRVRGACSRYKPLVMIFCLVKDEPYLLSNWIPYHAALVGLENIMILDHGSSHESASVLASYASQGLKVYDASSFAFAEKASVLTRVMKNYKHCRFLLPLDIDEFLCLHDGRHMSCDREEILDAFTNLPDAPSVFKLGTFDVCNSPDEVYQDPLVDMTSFHFFPPQAEYVFSTQAAPKSFYPGRHFVSTDSGNHFGCVNNNRGPIFTRLALAHYHTRGYQHFVVKHANSAEVVGVNVLDIEDWIRAKRDNHHWLTRYLAITRGEGRKCFVDTICSLEGLRETALAEVINGMSAVRYLDAVDMDSSSEV